MNKWCCWARGQDGIPSDRLAKGSVHQLARSAGSLGEGQAGADPDLAEQWALRTGEPGLLPGL